MLVEGRERVLARGEGVHEHQRQPRPGALAQVEDLADDDVQEALAVAHLQQRLGLRHPHARAQAAVELEHDGLVEHVLVARLRQVVDGRHALDGLDVALGEHALVAGLQQLVVVAEARDRRVAGAVGAQLLDAGVEAAHASSRLTVSGENAGRQIAT